MSRTSGTLTIVFTDTVSSTALTERLGDLRYHELRAANVNALRSVIARHGGRVVKDLGDGLMVVFTSARSGVLAAAEMQHAVAGGELELKIGVHTGEAIEQDGDFHGQAVNIASRICNAAEGGEVLLSDLSHSVVQGSGDLGFDEVRLTTFKGLEGPQPVHPLLWGVLPQQSTPGLEVTPASVDIAIPPPSLLQPGRFAFVGRSDTIDGLWNSWKDVDVGARHLVLLAGEPGVGKTRLASELARRVAEAGGSVLAGRCDEDLGVAYLPFVEALRHCCQHVPVERRRGVLGRLPGELQRLWPELPEVVPGLPPVLDADPETQRYRLFDAVVSWLATLSVARPVLLVLDDLHWATQPTLQLVRHILRAEEAPRVLLCATYRDTDLGRTHPLADALADLRRLPNVERFAVGGLSADDVESFLERAAGHELDANGRRLAEAVHRNTGGNALFVGETLLHLVESGRVYAEGNRWRYDADDAQLGVPEGLREVVGRRLSRLGDDVNDVLRVASVAGLEFDERVVAAAAGKGAEELDRLLAVAAQNGIITDTAPLRYRFTHAVLRDTLYEELRPSPRIRAHIAVAQAIESVFARRLDAHLADLAHHYSEAAPAGNAEQAIDCAIQAAIAAEAGAAHEEAARFYDLALEALEWEPDDERRADLLLARGAASWRMNNVDAARSTFEQAAAVARKVGDPERLARAALGAGGGSVRAWWIETGRIQQWLIGLLEEALASLPHVDGELRAQVMAMLARELAFVLGSVDRRRELCKDALAMARRVGEARTIARTQCLAFMATSELYTPEERVTSGEEVIAMARQVGDLELEAQGHYQALYGLLERGHLTEAKERIAIVTAIADTLAQPFWRWVVVSWQTVMQLCEGEFDEAEDGMRRAKELADEAGEVTGYQVYWIQISLLAHVRGTPAEATPPEAFKALMARYTTLSAGVLQPAYIDFVLGNASTALATLEAVSLNDFAAVPDDSYAPYAFSGSTWMVWYLNATSMARPLYNRLLPRRGTMALPMGPHVAAPQVDVLLSVLAVLDGRLDDAEVHLGEAAEWSSRFRIPWYEVGLATATAELAVAQGAPHAASVIGAALAQSLAIDEHFYRPLIERLTGRLENPDRPIEPILLNSGSPALRRGLVRRVRARVDSGTLAVVSRMVANASDEQLDARFGSARMQRLVFVAMARAFRPDLQFGFEGEIGYELSRYGTGAGPPDIDQWTFLVSGTSATVRPGPPRDPAVVFRCSLVTFVRMVSGIVEPLVALFERDLKIEGDLLLAGRVRELFGGVAALGAIDAVAM